MRDGKKTEFMCPRLARTCPREWTQQVFEEEPVCRAATLGLPWGTVRL